MNLNKARSILNVSETDSPDEIKKKYKQLCKQYHPDINKDPGAEAKFKEVGEAYQVVSSGKSTDHEDRFQHHEGGFNPFEGGFNPFNPFGKQVIHEAENIDLYTTISFAESVLGCKKDLQFTRNIKCKDCNGQGESNINNGCEKCHGSGQITGRQGHMMFIRTCDKCGGRTQSKPCTTCHTKGTLSADTSINVSVPGGVQNGNILRIGGMGHFSGSFGPMDQNSDVHLHISVTPTPGLMLENQHVISNLDISLLEALTGCNKTVSTVLGDKEINIKKLSKNKDEVIINNHGVNRRGHQKVILNIIYPNNVDNIISILQENKD